MEDERSRFLTVRAKLPPMAPVPTDGEVTLEANAEMAVSETAGFGDAGGNSSNCAALGCFRKGPIAPYRLRE